MEEKRDKARRKKPQRCPRHVCMHNIKDLGDRKGRYGLAQESGQ
jgi:hypothetical protein